MTKSEKEPLQLTEDEIETIQPEQAISCLNNATELLQDAYQKPQPLEARLNDKGEVIDVSGVFHPCLNDKGERVIISCPTASTPMSAFADPNCYAVMLPNGQAPKSLNGITFESWLDVPESVEDWMHVEGQVNLEDPPLTPKHGKKLAAGVVILEPDGRFWLVAPTNAFGGYKTTFPKGRLEAGMTPQATAIKEAYEEAGLQVQIIAYIGDFERSMTLTRYYIGHRVSGLPTQMHWESQAVMLVPKSQLFSVLNHPNDHAVIAALDKLKLIG